MSTTGLRPPQRGNTPQNNSTLGLTPTRLSIITISTYRELKAPVLDMTKFVFVTGGVVSSLGKGIA
ncbi:MAG: hypothetical protein ACKOXU_01380, partial [Limnohabitans sp.]